MSSITKDQLIFDTSATADSDNVGAYVRSSDGTLITHTTVGGDERLDTTAALFDGTGNAISSTGGALNVSDGGGSLTVDATDLDIRDLAHTQDTVALGDGTNLLVFQVLDAAFDLAAETIPISGVRRDADTSPVSADGDAHPFVFDDAGQLKVRANVVASVEPTDAEFLKGTVAGNTDALLHMGAVRQDTLAGFTGVDDGDYTSLKVDSLGRLYVAAAISGDVADDAPDSGNPLKVGSRAFDGALTAVSASNDRADLLSDMYRRVYVNDSPNINMTVIDAAMNDVAAEIAASPLLGRRRMLIQNIGNNEVYLGATGVTTSTGIVLRRRTSVELDLGEDINIFGICDTGETTNLRVMQIA